MIRISSHDDPPNADWAIADEGLGAQLVDAFEAEARAHGCAHFYLETLSSQAPDFYAKLGYRSADALDVYPHGIVKQLMLKTI